MTKEYTKSGTKEYIGNKKKEFIHNIELKKKNIYNLDLYILLILERFFTGELQQLHLSKQLKELLKLVQMEEKNRLINEFQFVD